MQKIAYKIVKNKVDDHITAFMRGDDVKSIGYGSVDTETAMKYSAMFACNRVLSETLASMPVMEYRKLKNGEREQTSETAAYNVLHNKPNDEMAPFSFKECGMTAINIGGNSVSERLVNKKNELIGLYPYQWEKVNISRDSSGKLIYRIKNGTKTKELQRNQVFHIPGPSTDGIIGMTPIEYMASSILLGLSYESFGVDFFRNGANPSGAFGIPESLDDPAFNRLKEDIKKNWTGLKNTGVPLILEGGMTFQPFTIKPVDAQLIESKRWQVEDICRIYRVPLHLVQDLSRSTNNNIEHQSLEFVMYTMLPHCKRWEENANMQLLTESERKAGYYIEFKMDSLLRGDAQSRAVAYATARQWGWMSVNDIRRLENMPSIGAPGDIYLTPLNMGEAGKTQDNIKAMSEKIYEMITERK